jgi:hypothetical protein
VRNGKLYVVDLLLTGELECPVPEHQVRLAEIIVRNLDIPPKKASFALNLPANRCAATLLFVVLWQYSISSSVKTAAVNLLPDLTSSCFILSVSIKSMPTP